MNRIAHIHERLNNAFSPSKLEIIDDGHKHIGHVGSQGGAGHYTIIISATYFKDMSRIETHRKIYEVLQDLIPDQIHALSIQAS